MWTDLNRIDDVIPQNLDEMAFEEDPAFFMFILPKMLVNYQRYGQCCYLNVIRGLIKKRTIMDSR